MKELIPITRQPINEVETLTCDGRKLHEYLEVGRDFSSWLKDRIEKYGFGERTDYLVFTKSGENLQGGRPSKEYILSLDMAKQLAMVENNDKGAEVRRYFIECERIAKDATSGYKTQPRRSSSELNAREASRCLRMMAKMNVYPAEMQAVFTAKAVVLLTGEPIQPLLPPVKDSRDVWLSPTALAERFGVNRNVIGRTLKSLNLHGENDSDHRHSQPLWDKSPHSSKEVVSYIYDPEVVIPALVAVFNPPRETAQ